MKLELFFPNWVVLALPLCGEALLGVGDGLDGDDEPPEEVEADEEQAGEDGEQQLSGDEDAVRDQQRVEDGGGEEPFAGDRGWGPVCHTSVSHRVGKTIPVGPVSTGPADTSRRWCRRVSHSGNQG